MHEFVTSDLTALDPEWAVGLGMRYTLFDGFQGKNKIAAARTRVHKVKHLRDKVRRDLRSLVVKRYEELEKARQQYDTYGSTLELASENLRVRLHAFQEGLGTSLEVVDATLSHARAQLGRFKAAFDFDLAFFQLLEASGKNSHCLEYLDQAVPVTEPDPETTLDLYPVEEKEAPSTMESDLK